MRTLQQVGMLALVAAFAAGCGGSSSPTHNKAEQVSTTTPTEPVTTATRPRSRATKTTTTAAQPTGSPSTTSPTAPGTRTAPPPIPAGTPPAPDGLRQTVGYSSYDLCSSQCSGSVPPGLRRPLHVPTATAGTRCPLSAGNGPVKPMGSATSLTIAPFIGSPWAGGGVTWTVSGYSGPVLIRGRQVGGPNAVGFGEGHTPYDELQLLGPAMGAPHGQWPSFTRVRGPGCYAYQLDGEDFSEVIVFQAVR